MDLKIIDEAIYNLCVNANTKLTKEVYDKLVQYGNRFILKNAQIAAENKMPLCQDTGQVMVFLKVGQDVHFEGGNLNLTINNAVERAYKENLFRLSVVEDALHRKNTATNTPCIIYTDITEGNSVEINLLIKGAGAENMSAVCMMSPTDEMSEIKDFVVKTVEDAGMKACPPMFIGVGVGGTMDWAALLSKKALFEGEYSKEIHDAVKSLAADVRILTDFTHIASMPVAVTLNCHSSRHAKCVITDEITYCDEYPNEFSNEEPDFSDYIKVHTNEVEKIKSLKAGQKVLLSGDICTARDAAHKRMISELPFDIKDKIIFYAGPCPCGAVGPTTSTRMDKFAPFLYEKGLLATIGKGERNISGRYFTMQGGVASYIGQKVKSREVMAYEDLCAEAVYKLEVVDIPLLLENS